VAGEIDSLRPISPEPDMLEMFSVLACRVSGAGKEAMHCKDESHGAP
jgi:hypothetical protein